MPRGLDGAPDQSSYDDAVASLCRSKDTSKNLDGRLVPTFVQTTASSVTVTFPPPVADYGATYLTDQDGTIVGFGQASSAADSLALDFDGSPLRLTLHVHLTGACRTVRSAPMSTWRTVLEEWEYMSGGGVTPNSSRWDEPTLQKSAPTLQLLPSDGPTRRARVTMLQQPDLPVPLLFVACSSSFSENEISFASSRFAADRRIIVFFPSPMFLIFPRCFVVFFLLKEEENDPLRFCC